MGRKRKRPSINYKADDSFIEIDDSDDDYQGNKLYKPPLEDNSSMDESGDEEDFDGCDSDDDDEDDADDEDGNDNEDDDDDDDDEISDEESELDSEYDDDAVDDADDVISDVECAIVAEGSSITKSPKMGTTKETKPPSAKKMPSSSKKSPFRKAEPFPTDCTICLGEFTDQLIGNPENCKHLFCSDCIYEWSKTVNSCPVDRQKFNKILIKSSVNGPVIEEMFIEDSVPVNVEEEFEDLTACQVCFLSDREDRMLLCDACDDGYHLECLDPPLDCVPIDDWYCSNCAPNRPQPRRQVQSTSTVELRPNRRRSHGARTAQQSANFARAARAWFSGEVGANLTSFIGYRPRSMRGLYTGGRRTKRKKKTRAKKKTEYVGKRKRSRSKRKTPKTKKSSKSSTSKKSKTPEGEPNSKKSRGRNKKSKEGPRRLSMLGSASLEPTLSFNLFGNKYDLDEFCEEPSEEKPQVKPEKQEPKSDDPDLLSSIIEASKNLDSQNVIIKRDGSLVPKTKRNVRRILSDGSDDESDSVNGKEKFSKRRKPATRKILSDDENDDILYGTPANKINISSDVKTAISSKRPHFSNAFPLLDASTSVNETSNLENSLSQAKPSLEEIRSWRTNTPPQNLTYKPLPAVADFKSIKIPKLKRKADDKEENREEFFSNSKADNSGVEMKRVAAGASSQDRRPISFQSHRQRINRNVEKKELDSSASRTAVTLSSKVPDKLTPRVPIFVNKTRLDNNDISHKNLGYRTNGFSYRPDEARVKVRSEDQSIDRDRKRLIQPNIHVRRTDNGINDVSENNVRQKSRVSELARMVAERRKSIKEKQDSSTSIQSEETDNHDTSLSFNSRIDDQNTLKDANGGGKVDHSEKFPENRLSIETSPGHYSEFAKRNSVLKPAMELNTRIPDYREVKPSSVLSSKPYNSKDPRRHENSDFLSTEDERAIVRRRGILRLHRMNLAESEVKKALKTHFKSGNINREEYKTIMKKCVTKILETESTIASERVERLVLKYICKLRGIKY